MGLKTSIKIKSYRSKVAGVGLDKQIPNCQLVATDSHSIYYNVRRVAKLKKSVDNQ